MLINFLFMSMAFSQNAEKLNFIQHEIDSGNHKKIFNELRKIEKSSLNKTEEALYYTLFAKYYELNNEDDKALQYYLEAKKNYKDLNKSEKENDINHDIAYLLFTQDNSKGEHWIYLNQYLAFAKKNNDNKRLAVAYLTKGDFLSDEGKYNESLKYYKKALAINSVTPDNKLRSTLYNNMGVLYNEYLAKHDSALYYYQKDLPYLKSKGRLINICYNYINQAGCYYYQGNNIKGIEYLHKADSIPISECVFETKKSIYNLMSLCYNELKDHEKSYEYLVLTQTYTDSLNEEQQKIAVNDIQTKYKTKEKELENTVLKGNIKTNRILLYTFTGLLIASLVIGFLIIKNARRREKISQQDKLIEQQKLEKALKDYELHSIDLMLEGQEKERQRIANDLHDNLGSMLATLKINFENLKLRKNEMRDDENKLYERTDELIEEAYQKVRRLAHAKNAGVFASEGLIPAIKKLAEKISIPEKLKIDVISFGFNERLENTLEIAIFRAIQELSTNIIKHSGATEATIHLTHHEDNINIIIEDNGVGFDSSTINMTNSMGLQTIRKKVEQLNGTFIIDATPNKGTTIIIDIPV